MKRLKKFIGTFGAALLSLACTAESFSPPASAAGASDAHPAGDGPTAVATFAGGCFWCVESAFDEVDGVHQAVSGYTGGGKAEASYEQVSAGRTTHVEAVQITYDRGVIGYDALLDIFWRQIDPTDPGGQFADRGSQYRTFIFFHDEKQEQAARRSKAELASGGKFDGEIVTEIVPATPFYPAEEYHQDYWRKNPGPYKRYRYGSGRTPFLERVWGPDGHLPKKQASDWVKPGEVELREQLTPLQFYVTQEEGTERPFDNEYWDNKTEGIYVDVVSGEPLFSSLDKFSSGTGWPSFTRPLHASGIVEKEDRTLMAVRTELRSRQADSHLGHLFDDGPAPTGLRYCINSASLRFVPREELAAEGYGDYEKLFERAGGE